MSDWSGERRRYGEILFCFGYFFVSLQGNRRFEVYCKALVISV